MFESTTLAQHENLPVVAASAVATSAVPSVPLAWEHGPGIPIPDTPAAAALALVEMVERLKAALDVAALSAWRALHAQVRAECEHLDLPGMPPARRREYVAALARSATVDEVMAATGIGQRECERRLSFATADPRRTATALTHLRGGTASLQRVLRIHGDTTHLDPEVADTVAARVLAPPRGCPVPSERLVSARLRRQLARHAPDPATARASALAARTAEAEFQPEGVAALVVTGDGARIAAATDRVDALARAVRAAGDPLGRTLAQLRSDVALDLVLNGEVAPGRVTDADSPLRLVGAFPPARVNLVVGLSTLLGQDDGLGELPGHGYLAAAHAREVATTDGSRWRCLVADPASGRLVELSTRSYRPTEAIRRHVLAHDAVCRAPGCTVPAAACDLDHERPFPSGRTSTANLSAKHRRHHALKTTGLWTSRGDPLTGTLTWRTFAGRTYITHPHDYRELSEPGAG